MRLLGDMVVPMDANTWLTDQLTQGPMTAQDVTTAGMTAGFSRATIYRAADRLGVRREDVSEPTAGSGRTPIRSVRWSLPDSVLSPAETTSQVEPLVVAHGETTSPDEHGRLFRGTMFIGYVGEPMCDHGLGIQGPRHEFYLDRGRHLSRGFKYLPSCWRVH